MDEEKKQNCEINHDNHEDKSDTNTDENVDVNENSNEDENISFDTLKELKLEEKIQEQEKQIAVLKDEYIRVHADFENTKKRLEREKTTALEYANELFARDLLLVVDTLENALLQEIKKENEEIIKPYKTGVELTLDQLKKSFKKHNIEEISTKDGFDPNFHDALMKVESKEHESGDIVQVLQKGYKYKDRLLRATKVSIAK